MNITNFIKEFNKDFVARYGVDHPDVVEQGLYWCGKREEFVYRVVLSSKRGLVDLDDSEVSFGYAGTRADFIGDVAWATKLDEAEVERRCKSAGVFDESDE